MINAKTVTKTKKPLLPVKPGTSAGAAPMINPNRSNSWNSIRRQFGAIFLRFCTYKFEHFQNSGDGFDVTEIAGKLIENHFQRFRSDLQNGKIRWVIQVKRRRRKRSIGWRQVRSRKMSPADLVSFRQKSFKPSNCSLLTKENDDDEHKRERLMIWFLFCRPKCNQWPPTDNPIEQRLNVSCQ